MVLSKFGFQLRKENDMTSSTEWAIIFGVLTLASWIVGGLMAVFGPQNDARHITTGPFTSTFIFGLNVTGLIMMSVMIAIMLKS
jgi:hypothetical protein